MVVDIEPRLAARREEVAEARARTSLARLLWVLGVGAILAGAVWLARSPLLVLHEIEVEGIARAEIDDLLTRSGVVEGRPLVLIRTGEVVEVVEADPRIESAVVQLRWPQGIVIHVQLRQPVAWSPLSQGYGRVALDGSVISEEPQFDATLPLLDLRIGPEPTSEALGGLAFLAELDPQAGADVTVYLKDAELWARVEGVEVRLGRPIDMEEKARALIALFANGIAPETSVNLLAPTRPALVPAPSGDSQVQPEP